MRVRVFVALLVAGLVLAGCSRGTGQADARPLVVVLFDVSKSTQDPAIRERYLASFGRVLDAVAAEHGTVIGDVIDENPLAHSSYPIDATFTACNPLTDNKLVCDAHLAQLRRDVTTTAQQILSGVPVLAGTDIHDGVGLAERVFAAYPEATSRSLVVLSDMVERSPQLNAGRSSFDDQAASATLDAFTASGTVPDLSGVHVYIAGAGVGSSTELPAARILSVQRFWLSYFGAAGADLPPERYGAALVRFP